MIPEDQRLAAFARLNARGYRVLGVGRGSPVCSAADAVQVVADAVFFHAFYTPEQLAERQVSDPMPTRDDLLDAIFLVDECRCDIDRAEHRLTEAARALGVGWDEIGEAFGYPDKSAKQSAASRFGRLLRSKPHLYSLSRRPRRRPPAPKTD